MHKDAGDLEPGDCFLMAGGAYEIKWINEVADDSYIKLRITPILGDLMMGSIIIKKDTLFSTL